MVQFEKELSHSAEEWRKSQLVTLQRIEQVNESIKVSGILTEYNWTNNGPELSFKKTLNCLFDFSKAHNIKLLFCSITQQTACRCASLSVRSHFKYQVYRVIGGHYFFKICSTRCCNEAASATVAYEAKFFILNAVKMPKTPSFIFQTRSTNATS